MEETDHRVQMSTVKKDNKKKHAKICLENCNSPIIINIANSMGMEIVKYTDEWDLYWSNVPIDLKRSKNMKKFQRTNHFPGMSEICRKDLLAWNLNNMMNKFPNDFNFFPKTWYLPSDYSKLKTHIMKNKHLVYILKPTTGSRGTGIYLTKSLKDIPLDKQMICQLYILKPLLMDGFKFDMRLYVLIASCDPLVIYVYNDGLVRLATVPYKKPNYGNVENLYMHLTNYSVNKQSKMYIDNENYGSKRRITTLNTFLFNNGYDVKTIWEEIDDVIIKTVILAYPLVNRSYKVTYSGHKYTEACFDILGFDILLDENGKPHLLEVNQSPDFHTETALDKIVKKELLTDTFKLLQLDKSFKEIVSHEDKWKTVQQSKKLQRNVYAERYIERREFFKRENTKWASENMGNYRLVFSEDNSILYYRFFYWNESTLYQDTACIPQGSSIFEESFQNTIQKKQTKKDKSITKLKSEQMNNKTMKKYSYGNDNAFNEMKLSIEKVKQKNKKMFPDVQSCLFKKFYKKNRCFQDGWKDSPIDQAEENQRLDKMLVRSKLVFDLDIKGQIYREFQKYNNTCKHDETDYAKYQEEKDLLTVKPFTYKIVHIGFD